MPASSARSQALTARSHSRTAARATPANGTVSTTRCATSFPAVSGGRATGAALDVRIHGPRGGGKLVERRARRVQVRMVLDELQPPVPPAAGAAVAERHRRLAAGAAHALHDDRQRPGVAHLHVLDLDRGVGEGLEPLVEEATQPLVAAVLAHAGEAERRHVPQRVLVEVVEDLVEAPLVPG